MGNEKQALFLGEKPLDKEYWDSKYKSNAIGWDLGQISPPIKTYIDSLKDKNCSVLIPGCGNSHEAEYLLKKGFTNITVIDIAPTLVKKLKQKFTNNNNIKILLGDFFKHSGKYDLILEQTFFCALPPMMRQKYVWKIHRLLKDSAILAGLLFNKTFDSGPPFGGNNKEYKKLFQEAFDFLKMDLCQNSIEPRANSELFIELRKNNQVEVNLYQLEGISSGNSKDDIIKKMADVDGVLNVSLSENFTDLLMVSKNKIPIATLQSAISRNENIRLKKKNNERFAI